ncbi:MAG: NAD-dependent protein deacylase, partial [Candidatus Heimdallarchaeota archaeon]|nr:NAD-dependent protein deacylase [Candidatus Heimdallarchaeota archaeon]
MQSKSSDLLNGLNLGHKSIVAIVGAGASVASGLKTFRGKDGYYRNRSPEELASVQGFRDNPNLLWEWYSER